MADHVYLSLWLRDYNEINMLQAWKRVIEAFPFSAGGPAIRSLAIYPFNWSETPVFERSFGEGISAEDVIDLAAEFLHDDYAYEVEVYWDLWLPDPTAEVTEEMEPEALDDSFPEQEPGWRLTPMTVSLACTGPKFNSDDVPEDRADIEINFGLDAPFLPFQLEEDEFPEYDPDVADIRARQNLQQLIEFVHRLDEILPVERRLLWCESGENLAEKILDAWNEQI